MVSTSFRQALWLIVLLMSHVARTANTFRMAWSSQTFGPDGPWQAVEIQVGSNRQVISLYPGGIFASHFLSPKVCSNSTLGNVCYALTAGLYDKTLSSSDSFGSIAFPAQVDYTGGALQIDGEEGYIGTDTVGDQLD